jgi:uncharacterized membrane protein
MLILAILVASVLACILIPNFVHDHEFKQHALRSKLCGYLLAILSTIQILYINYNAFYNGQSAIGFRRGAIFSYLFREDLPQAAFVYLINTLLAVILAMIARECYREHNIWLKQQ